MGDDYFSVKIEDPEGIYAQLVESLPMQSVLLGRTELVPPLHGISTAYSAFGESVSMRSVILAPERLLTLPPTLISSFLPVPGRMLHLYNGNCNGTYGLLHDRSGNPVYETHFARIMAAQLPFLGIRLSFGVYPEEHNLAPEKRIGSPDEFNNTLFSYAFALEDLITSLYEELRHISLLRREYQEITGNVVCPREPTILYWKPHPDRAKELAKITVH